MQRVDPFFFCLVSDLLFIFGLQNTMCFSRGWSVKLPRSKLTKTMQLTLFLKALIFVIQICYKSRLITKQILRKQRAKTSNIKMKINLYVPTIQASIFQVWLAIILEKFVTTTTPC